MHNKKNQSCTDACITVRSYVIPNFCDIKFAIAVPQSFYTVTNRPIPTVKKGTILLHFSAQGTENPTPQLSLTDMPNPHSYRQNPFEGYS